jgi:hypothetical protein
LNSSENEEHKMEMIPEQKTNQFSSTSCHPPSTDKQNVKESTGWVLGISVGTLSD